MSNYQLISYNSPVFSGIHAIAMNPKRSDHRGYMDRIYFPDEPILRNKKIRSVMIFGDLGAGSGDAPDGYWMDSTKISVEWSSAHLTLCDQNRFEFIKSMPCLYFSAFNQIIPIDRQVDLLDSYIQLSGNYDTDETYLFLFFYEQDCQSYEAKAATNIDSIEFALNTIKGERTYLPNYPPLEDRPIRNIYLQTSSLAAGGSVETPNGYTVADLNSKYITLMYRRMILFYRVPARMFVQYNEQFRFRMADLLVTLSDSYVETSPSDYTSDGSMVFSFEYKKN